MKESELRSMTGAEMINALENIGGRVPASVRKNLVADKDSAKKSFIRRYGRMLVDEQEELTSEEQEKKMWEDKIAKFNSLCKKIDQIEDDYSFSGLNIYDADDMAFMLQFTEEKLREQCEKKNAEILAVAEEMHPLYDELFAHFYAHVEVSWEGYNYTRAGYSDKIAFLTDKARDLFVKNPNAEYGYLPMDEVVQRIHTKGTWVEQKAAEIKAKEAENAEILATLGAM